MNQDSRTGEAPRVLTIGSLNMDLVVRSRRMARPGETLTGEDLSYVCGGKGANQALAAARLGAESLMAGRVGDDGFGGELRENLGAAGVDVRRLLTVNDCASGVAVIHVDATGENAITIIPGANGRMGVDAVRELEPVIADADVLVMQLEIPLESVVEAVRIAREHGVVTVLDPAPAPPRETGLPDVLVAVDVLTPNQSEAAALTGIECGGAAGAEAAARALLDRGAGRVVVKLGGAGALSVDAHGITRRCPAFDVDVVDTTAAGDAFTAGLAVGIGRGGRLDEHVLEFACAAGALATTVHGAGPSMPSLEAVEELLRSRA